MSLDETFLIFLIKLSLARRKKEKKSPGRKERRGEMINGQTSEEISLETKERGEERIGETKERLKERIKGRIKGRIKEMIKEQIGQQIGGLVTEESLSIKQREMKERLMREGWINREAMRNGEISTVEAKEEMTGVTEMRDVEELMTDGVEVDGEEGGEEETLVEGTFISTSHLFYHFIKQEMSMMFL